MTRRAKKAAGGDGTIYLEQCDDPAGVSLYLLDRDGRPTLGIVLDAAAAIGAGRRLVSLGLLVDAKAEASGALE